MAVKHKVVECVEAPKENRLAIILRALQSINNAENTFQNEHAKFCEKIVYNLGMITIPSKTEDYISFMEDIKNIQEILVQACSNENVIFATLKALYNAISEPSKHRQPTMAIVLQLVDVKSLPTAVAWILRSGYTADHFEEALMTLCNWLSRWTWTPNLGPLVLCFMQGLEEEHHYEIILDVTLTYIEQLFRLLILPEARVSVGPVVFYMLSKMQGKRELFFKIKPHISMVLHSLDKENSESSRSCLEEIVSLCFTLIKHFPDENAMYEDLLPILQSCSPTLNIQKWECKTWSDESAAAIPLHDGIGKVGLANLGNTCYMNSILQALFMTKLFCNDILLSTRDTMPLFSKLKVLFALLQYSRRTSLPPHEILRLARPPGFLSGQQHDSSEFLGYLLDVLHEQERCSGVNSQAGDGVVGPSLVEPTVVQRSFGGKAVTVSRCGSCNTQSEHTDHFRELQLSFPNHSSDQSVQKLLNYYLQPEPLCGDNQYHCDTCRGLTDGERVTRVVEPPSRLILTLKQFRYDPASQERTKLLQHVKLDLLVNLNDIRYELYAAVVHAGSSLDSGHYYTFARDNEGWYRFNDILVTPTNFDELCGVRPPATPYILFYRKQDCPDPAILQQTALPPTLIDILLRDCSELDTERRRRPTKVYDMRNKRNDDPPPPGCGGGSFIGSLDGSRFIC